MRLVRRFVIHVELTIMELAVRIVVIRRSTINQLVESEDIFQLNVVGQLISEVQLRGVRIEFFTVQAVRCCAKLVAPNLTREYARVQRCS